MAKAAAAWRGLGEVRKAADAFDVAADLAPGMAAAHVGFSLAMSDAGEAEPAKFAALRAPPAGRPRLPHGLILRPVPPLFAVQLRKASEGR